MTISSANAMELKYKQPTKLFTNGCIQIITANLPTDSINQTPWPQLYPQ